MEELRWLVERAGASAGVALRLWDAGYHSLGSLARAEPGALVRAGGLPLPAACWLVQKAREELEPSRAARRLSAPPPAGPRG